MVRKTSIGAISLVLVLLVTATVYIVGAKPRPIEAHDGVKLTPLRTISTVEARAKLCWFGDEGDTIVRELEQHSFG